MTSEQSAEDRSTLPPLSVGQWLLLLLLAAVQFTHIVDFMIIMPLETEFEKDLAVTTQEFGLLVSVYGFAAAGAGLALAPLLDRFDRKHTLLTLYAGFSLGTLACAFAPNYWLLVGARLLTGAFGGVVASSVLAIVGDAFPAGRRATAMGVVMSAFSIASIAGVPAGLYLAELSPYHWRAPFTILGGASAMLFLFACWAMPAVRGHLDHDEPISFMEVVSRPAHLRAYLLMIALVMSTFTMMPFLAPFLVKNVGRPNGDLRWVYLCGGATTLLTMNLIGRLADRFPRLMIFRILALLALVPIVGLSWLPWGSSLSLVLFTTTAIMVLTSGRMVPAMAMITSTAEPRYRGSFLSFNAAVQQLAAGMAPLIAGFIMGNGEQGGPLVRYDVVALVGATAGLASVFLAGRLQPIGPPVEAVPFPVEGA